MASNTPIQSGGRNTDLTVSDFWAWAGSDLLDNALRGQLAEFIVGSALGCIDGKFRREWRITSAPRLAYADLADAVRAGG